jgi:hypothetical protein
VALIRIEKAIRDQPGHRIDVDPVKGGGTTDVRHLVCVSGVLGGPDQRIAALVIPAVRKRIALCRLGLLAQRRRGLPRWLAPLCEVRPPSTR